MRDHGPVAILDLQVLRLREAERIARARLAHERAVNRKEVIANCVVHRQRESSVEGTADPLEAIGLLLGLEQRKLVGLVAEWLGPG